MGRLRYTPPPPEERIVLEQRWARERHGITQEGIEERAQQIVATRSKTKR